MRLAIFEELAAEMLLELPDHWQPHAEPAPEPADRPDGSWCEDRHPDQLED